MPLNENEYCTPDGNFLLSYGPVTEEMKKIKSTFRGKTYTYKDLIRPLNITEKEKVEFENFTDDFFSFRDELKIKLPSLTYLQFEQVLQIRGDFLETILNKKFYSGPINTTLKLIDLDIISLFDKFNVSKENQLKFKTGSAEKQRTLEIMLKHIQSIQYSN
ncbi:hypothetical protein [Lonepinella koalarum]